jgi:hypothetical protein
MKKLFITTALAIVFASSCSVQKNQREIASADVDNRGVLSDFMTGSKPYELTDVAKIGLSANRLFAENREASLALKMKNTASVCANRAHTWAYDMYRRHRVNSGKIIIYFGSGLYAADDKQWWYHIAPYVIENGQEMVLDGGFSRIRGPLPAELWIKDFSKGNVCKELFKKDVKYNSLTKNTKMLPGLGYDEKTGLPRGGEAMCYIRRIPMEYWTPLSVYLHEFNKNARGEDLVEPFNGTDFDAVDGNKFNDVMIACNEATTTNFGGMLKKGLKRCRDYFGFAKDRNDFDLEE